MDYVGHPMAWCDELEAKLKQSQSTAAEQTAATAEQLNKNAEGLQQIVGQFKVASNVRSPLATCCS